MRLLTIFCFLTSVSAIGQTSLFEFRSSTCDQEEDPSRLRTQIIRRELTNNILTVEIASTATCCVDFLPKIEMKNGILFLDFEETGNPCECGCCYEFVYRVSGIKNKDVEIIFRKEKIETSTEKYLTFPIQFQISKGDTVNLKDRYGLRQGKWLHQSDSLAYFIYSDDRPIRFVRLYSNKLIKSERISEKVKFRSDDKDYFTHGDFNRLVEYYENGKKKKECYNDKAGWMNNYEKGRCKEWNEKGDLLYEGDYRK
jgi:hypothetical protein